MEDFTLRHFKYETLPNGANRYSDEIDYIDYYGVEKHDEEHIVFRLNGVQSKPIKVVYDPEWSWEAQKTQIRSNKTVDGLLKDLQDKFWSCYTYHFAELYCKQNGRKAV